MTAERFTVDSDGKWWDKIKHEYVTLDSLFRLVEELDYTINEMAKTIRIYDDGYIDLNKKYKKLADEKEQLKQRNDRQAKQLDRLYNLIEQKDWRTLNDILDDFKRCEEQLQREWRTYK